MKDFVHLHNHTMWSQLDGYGTPQQYAERAVVLGFNALAMTDHGHVDGTIRWQRACKKTGITPIIGCEAYIVPDMLVKNKGDRRGHITILVRGPKGWKALLKWLSKANIEGFYRRPRIDYSCIITEDEEALKELVFLTGCSQSFLHLSGGTELFRRMIEMELNVFLEIMPHVIISQKETNQLAFQLQKETGIPFISTNDCHYVTSDQAVVQEVLLAIQRKAKWDDPNRWKFGFEGLHLRTAEEMIQEFERQGVLARRQYLTAMANTMKAVDLCSGFTIPKQDINLPITRYEKLNPNQSADEILEVCCRLAFGRIFQHNPPIEYSTRFTEEMGVITKKGFSRYFCVIYELVEWCKLEGIMVGPGRGSSGGSLISYLLGITQVDPIKYGLLFERFISEDRIDYPDIDLDFQNDKCDLVREHLENEYGKYNVVGVSTLMRLKSKAAVRDIGRVFDLPANVVDVFAKSIRPGEHDEGIIVNAAIETSEGRDFAQRYPEQFQLACALEGQIRASGRHPSALIVSGEDLRESDRGNLCVRTGVLVSNWDMEDCDHNGLMKIDVLKLDTLTVLNEARALIKDQGIDFEYEKLPLNDPEIFKELSAGNTASVFQFSGYASTKLCKEMGVDNFDDMVAITALARPGPQESGMTDNYVRRKLGAVWSPLHPAYEEITKNTYGVMVYQEQMMRAMVDLAGFSKSDSDRIRKVIGKKRDPKEFEPYRDAFIQGCEEKKTLTPIQANEFWEGLLMWAGYGFNLSHAVEYSLIGYWTAFMRIKYSTEFLCAQLSFGSDKGSAVKEALRLGYRIVTPKMGISDARRWLAKDRDLYMPFVEIKSIGESQAEKCCDATPRKGFFKRFSTLSLPKGELGNILKQIQAHDLNPEACPTPDECMGFFGYTIGDGFKPPEIIVTRKTLVVDQRSLGCEACPLRKQATKPVLSSRGAYNAFIVCEAPGRDENKQGKGLVGRAGQVLWDELVKYDITRTMVHYGNVCKCWPSETHTPSKSEIDICFNKWLKGEILSIGCRLVLACGNTPLYALKGKPGGITELSGEIEWIDKIKSWVVWSVHPSSVLRSPGQNTELFQKGIERFATELKGGGL